MRNVARLRALTDFVGITRGDDEGRGSAILGVVVGIVTVLVATRLGLTFLESLVAAVVVGVAGALVFAIGGLLTRRAG